MYYSLRTRNAGIYYRWRKKYFFDRYSIFNLFANAFTVETIDPAKAAIQEDLSIRKLLPFTNTAPDHFHVYGLGDGVDRVENINSITGDTIGLVEKESFQEINTDGPVRLELSGGPGQVVSDPDSFTVSSDSEAIDIKEVLDSQVNIYIFDAETLPGSFIELDGHPVNDFEREEDRQKEKFRSFFGFSFQTRLPYRDLCSKKFESFDDATLSFEYAPGQYRIFKEKRFTYQNIRFSFRELYWHFTRTFDDTSELCDLKTKLVWPNPGMEFNDIRYTSTFGYSPANWIRIEFEDTAVAGSETVLITPSVTVPPENGLNYVITVGIEQDVSTNLQVVTALQADTDFASIITAEVIAEKHLSDTHPVLVTADPTTRDEIQETELVLHHGINCVAISSLLGQSNDEKDPELNVEHVVYFDKFYVHGIILENKIYLVDINGDIFKTDALIGFPDNPLFIDKLRRITPSLISYDYRLYYNDTFKDMTYKINLLNNLNSGSLDYLRINVIRDSAVDGETHYGLSFFDGAVDFNTNVKDENIFENELFFTPSMDNSAELIEIDMKFTEGTEQCLPLLHFRDKRIPTQIAHTILGVEALSFDNSGRMYVYDGSEYLPVNYHYDAYVLNENENTINFTDTYSAIAIDL